MKDLYKDAKQGDIVLLAGGENLAQTWFVMHLSLLGTRAAARWKKYGKMLGASRTERLSRRRFGGRQEFPYILSPDHFAAGVRVMYNSMGGWPLRFYSPPSQQAISAWLGRAAFLSIRDQESASILRQLDPALEICVAPDCAFLLSDLLPRDKLNDLISPRVRKLVEDAGEFLCFQCNPRYGGEYRDEIKRQLLSVGGRSGLRILLTPIGRIHSFEDAVFLTSLREEMGDRARMLPPSATIYDVAYAIASARLFCGTSLHGIVTAMTYGVPFVQLLTEDPKLRNNVKSWELNEAFPPTPARELASRGLRSLELSGDFVVEHSARLRAAASANMQRLAESILAG